MSNILEGRELVGCISFSPLWSMVLADCKQGSCMQWLRPAC